jgi:hypothetical protein
MTDDGTSCGGRARQNSEQLIFVHRLACGEYDKGFTVPVAWHDAYISDRGMLCDRARHRPGTRPA